MHVVKLNVIACSSPTNLLFISKETMKQLRDIGYVAFLVDPHGF